MQNPLFTKGSTVEVSSDDPGFEGAWYVASLIDQLKPSPTKKKKSHWSNKKSRKNQTQIRYLIKYHTLLKDGSFNESLTETVHPPFIRPLPPPNLHRGDGNVAVEAANEVEFEVCDVVDAYHREGWWIGVVKKVIVVKGGSKKYVVLFECHADEVEVEVEEVEFERAQLRLHIDWVDGRWQVAPKKAPEDGLVDGSGGATGTAESNNDADSGFKTPAKRGLKKCGVKKNTEGESETVGDVDSSVPSSRKKRVMSSGEKESHGKRSRSSAEVKNLGSKGNTKVTVTMKGKSQPDPIQQDSPLMEHEIITPETRETGVGKSHQKRTGRPPKPLAERSNSLLEGTELDSCSSPDHRDGSVNQSTVTSVGATTDYQQDWPFIKRSPIWATIASLELLQTPPQKPHFSPLKKINEVNREGLAIGHMVTFVNLVQRLAGLNMTDPVDILNNSLESLVDLETHGFDVGAIRGRINQLLSLKSKADQHEDKRKKVEEEIKKRNDEPSLDEEMSELEVKMQELKEKMAWTEIRMKVKEDEMVRLQSNLHRVSEEQTDLEVAFEKLVGTPLCK